jgi:hypothetical protein
MIAVLRSTIFHPLLIAILAVVGPVLARANDSSASMAAGGLELIRSDQVRMVSEVLRIAPRLVEVDYVFENTGRTDVTTLVAFPLPELSQTVWYYSPLNIPFDKNPNFVGFQVWVDGREIKPEIEIRAFGKTEITDDLRRLAVDPFKPDLHLRRPDVVDALRRLGVIIDDGPDSKPDPVADWSVRVNFHWSQTFPAGRQITVRHRYRPVHGNSYEPVDPKERNRKTKADQTLGGRWCLDQSYNAAELKLFARQYEAAAKQTDKVGRDYRVWYDNVAYVLITGANWRGPIGRFELQIDKGGAELVSTCPIPGLRLQRTPYGFSAIASDYTPTSDLDILFVSGRLLDRPDGGEAR